jgi:hypothetical protein
MEDDYLYLPQQDQPEASQLQKLWDARPWKGYAENPPSMAPQLGLALGLLHPRLGGATRDLGMATQMAKQGNAPAAMQGMPQGMPPANAPASQMAPMGIRQGTANSNKPMSRVDQFEAHLANLERQGVPYEQFPTWQAFFRGMD